MSGEQFVDELVGELESSIVGGEDAGDPRQIDVRNFGGGEVAGDDFTADVVGLSPGCEVTAELAGDGIATARADVDFR